MKNKTITLYVLLTLSFFSLFSCNKVSDTDRLHQRVDAFIDIIEQHKEKEIKYFFTNDFSAGKKFNKEQFFLFVRYHLKRNKNISIHVINKQVTHNKNYADITAKVLLLGSSEWLPERGQLYHITSRWKKEKDNWRVSKLRWDKI